MAAMKAAKAAARRRRQRPGAERPQRLPSLRPRPRRGRRRPQAAPLTRRAAEPPGRGARGAVGPARAAPVPRAVPAGPARRALRGDDGDPDPTRGEGHRARGMRVGIDLGTTYSLVARMDAEGRPALVPDHAESDVFHTPSVVHIAQNAAFVGPHGRAAAGAGPDDPGHPLLQAADGRAGARLLRRQRRRLVSGGRVGAAAQEARVRRRVDGAPAAGRGVDHGARALQRPAAQGGAGRGDAGRHRGAWVSSRSRWRPRSTTAWWAACTTRCCSSTTSAAAPSTRPR